jgi:hypothetical protein
MTGVVWMNRRVTAVLLAFLTASAMLLLMGCSSAGGPPASQSVSPSVVASRPATAPSASGAAPGPACAEGSTGATSRPGTVLVFFTCDGPDATTSAVTTESTAANDAGRLAEAMRALLAGPTQADQAGGFVSWFSAATREHLRRVVIRADGTAVVDFLRFSSIIPNASTSAGMHRLLSEIRATAFQFDRVTSLELRFDGSCDAFWTWLEAGKCQMLLRGAALPELPAATP